MAWHKQVKANIMLVCSDGGRQRITQCTVHQKNTLWAIAMRWGK